MRHLACPTWHFPSHPLIGSPQVDSNPERRRKAAFKAYEEREIPRMREENPGLKLSQVLNPKP